MLFRSFLIERIVEPRPVPEGARVDPEHYAQLQTAPGFVAFRCVARR